ncbi:MAG: protein translocase subunit SecF [Lactobacillaceae bacterium]|jgi:preprotein translocase SecF subunit|nr:protein translocase subunit SecF [Lactobacillaceae bacterium]
MKIFSWIIKDTNIDFMSMRKPTYALSILMVAASIALIALKGFNYGIDFSGGILIEIKSPEVIDMQEIREKLSDIDIGEVNLQTIGNTGDELMIRAQASNLDEKEQMDAVNKIKQIIGDDVDYRKVELVGPQVGDELKRDGIIAAVLALAAISIYVWVRFEWQFAIGTMIGLAQDGIVAAGLLSLFDMDFSLTTVAALLTLIGYSVNDKVVTYDRVRENLGKYKKMPQYDLINKSVNDVLSRTFLTGISTIGAASILLVLGGDTLRSFSFVLTFGILVGIYSSIFTSSLILNLFDLRKTQEEDKINPFGAV